MFALYILGRRLLGKHSMCVCVFVYIIYGMQELHLFFGLQLRSNVLMMMMIIAMMMMMMMMMMTVVCIYTHTHTNGHKFGNKFSSSSSSSFSYIILLPGSNVSNQISGIGSRKTKRNRVFGSFQSSIKHYHSISIPLHSLSFILFPSTRSLMMMTIIMCLCVSVWA